MVRIANTSLGVNEEDASGKWPETGVGGGRTSLDMRQSSGTDLSFRVVQ